MSSDVPSVEIINMEAPHVVMSSGEVLPVVEWQDKDGGVEEDPNIAVTLIAGPDRDGFFYRIDIDPTVLIRN